jgi:hypothetical protein
MEGIAQQLASTIDANFSLEIQNMSVNGRAVLAVSRILAVSAPGRQVGHLRFSRIDHHDRKLMVLA